MNNNLVDKVYLALELTKISCSDKKKNATTVMKDFNTFITELTGIEDIGEIKYLMEENECLREKLNKPKGKKEGLLINEEQVKNTIKYLKENSGNMEPYIYNYLMNFFNGQK